MYFGFQHRQARENHVAEPLAATVAAAAVDPRREDRMIAIEKAGKHRHLVGTAIQVGKTVRHFLQTDHVRQADAADLAADAGWIGETVAAFAILDVPAEYGGHMQLR